MFKFRKGDKVVVLTGRDRGKVGEIIKSVPDNDRVIVQGVNIVRRHTKPSASSSGGIVEKELSLHISNIAILDPKDKRPSRVGFRRLDDGTKVRFSKRSGEVID